MAFVIHNPPEFTLDVEQWTRQTKANGEQMAKNVIEPMLNNDIYLKEHLEELDGNAVKDGDKGAPGGVATLGENGKLVQHVEYNNVDNIPDTAWDDVTNKPRTYPPSFHTHNKSEVDLGNVDNTADTVKRVAYAASAGDADTLDGKHASAFATASHSHSNYASSSHTHNYLPLSGGTVTGSIKSTHIYPLLTEPRNAIVWGESANGYPTISAYKAPGGYQFAFMPTGWDSAEQLKTQVIINGCLDGTSANAIYGRIDNQYSLGLSGNRFKTLYATTGTIQTSDKNFKDNIQEFDASFVRNFIMGIRPVSYRLKDGDSGRTHYGTIAQDIEDLMEFLGIDSKDFAGFIKSPKAEQVDNPETEEIEFKTIEGEFIYALRYEEFISPLIKMVQIQQQKLEDLQKRIEKLEPAK